MNFQQLSDTDLEAQFNLRATVPGAERFLAEYSDRSIIVRERLGGRLNVAYGDTPRQILDVFPAQGMNSPVHIFIHGGYWRALDKNAHSFIAEPMVAAGVTTVVLNYELCPFVGIGEIVEQIRNAIAWVFRNAARFGGDPERLFLSGHSAGAHLAMMALKHDWEGAGLPARIIKGVVGISGVYELTPLIRTSLNQELHLTQDVAVRNSPTLFPPDAIAPVLIAVGESESNGFFKQSADFYAACRRNKVDCQFMQLEETNHFNIIFGMADPASPLHRAALQQMSIA